MKQNGGNKNSLNTLKLKNRRDVLELIRNTQSISIPEIAEATELSKVTVMKIVDHYLDLGLVVGVGKTATEERGKPAKIFALNANYKYMYCVKLDGYNMLSTLTNLRGETFASHTTLYDQRINLPQLLQFIGDAFSMLVERERVDVKDCLAAVAGLHGIIDPDSGVCFLSPQFPDWGDNIPLRAMLAEYLPDFPIHLDNWVHFYGRGEATVMKEPVNRFFLISSEIEGLNGALMLDGKLYRGHDCLSGEIGHMIVDSAPHAEVCQCGGRGCFEAAVSPKRMVARITRATPKHPESLLHPDRKTCPISFRDITAAADAGDELARTEIRRAARFFAIGIRNIMQIADPELILIQGEYSNAGTFFIDELRSQIPATSLLRLKKSIRVEYSRLGQYGAIIGAANHVADLFFANA